MIIQSIIINNYKSIGNSQNRLELNKSVTAILGKNESGKSNILSALSNLNLINITNEKYNAYLQNRKINSAISFSIETLPLENDNLMNSEPTIFTFNSKEILISGGLSFEIQNNSKINTSIEFLNLKKDKISSSYLNIYNSCITNLKNLNRRIFLNYVNAISSLVGVYPVSNDDEKEEFNLHIESLKIEITRYYNLFPRLYLYNDKNIKDTYTSDEINKEFTNPTGLPIVKMFNFLGIDKTQLLLAMGAGRDASTAQQRKIIIKLFKEKIANEFVKFYTQENIEIELVIENGNLIIQVVSDDVVYNYSERSEGLKWYFNLFVSLLSEGLLQRPIVILLDEPGVRLHINAQEELLKFFKDLCLKQKQILYTTHSPFMIDTDYLNEIRLIEKVDGNTLIHKNHYDNLLGVSKQETLSPLIQALGVSFGKLNPDLNRLNIITEGITDSLYIKAMLLHFDLSKDKTPFIIPAIGCGDIHSIASILIGWGCKFKIILDYDTAGFNEYNKLLKLFLEDGKDVFCVNSKSIEKEDMKINSETIESLLSNEDRKILAEDKTMAAKQFYDKALRGELKLTEFTINSFTRLFNYLSII